LVRPAAAPVEGWLHAVTAAERVISLCRLVTVMGLYVNIVTMSANFENSAATHFGRQMKKERLAHGWSLREFSARTGIDFTTASRIENGKRPPNEAVARACDAAWPERRGWFLEYYEESKSWVPAGFRSWAEYEDRAVTLRVWSPGVIDGLLQTESYARALLSTVPGATDEIVSARLANRMKRQQRVLMGEDPPASWFMVDELSLYRAAVNAEAMAEQMRKLAQIAVMPNVTLQVLPAVAHPANASELIITDSAAYVEHLMGGLVYTEGETVTALERLFTSIHSESEKASESLAMIERLGETWASGASPAFQAHKVGPA
jgi:transcriptional regulator with XRE-family HTH domain